MTTFVDTKTLGHILLVDEETHITDLLQYNLESEHYDVTVCTRAIDAKHLKLDDIRIILADAMTQPYSGIDLLDDIKNSPMTAHIPVIIVTHSDSEDDKLRAFDAGADDYVLKPFSLRELVARIRSVLRRHPIARSAAVPTMVKTFGEISIDLLQRSVSVNGEAVPLTKTEFAIIALLARNTGQFYNRREIYDEIWRDVDRGNNDRIVDTNISRLRKKLGSGATHIQNKSGYGYTLI